MNGAPRPAAAAALGALVVLAACTLAAPPADETLRGAGAAAAPAGIDALAEQAVAAARGAPDDAELQLAAAARLFAAADLRLQQATVAWLRAHPEASRADVLAADDRLTDAERQPVLSLCREGLAFAERAAAQAPAHVGAWLHTGLHLSLVAWASGPARALVAGHGGRLVAAIDRALQLEREHDHGAVLRLAGRFRSKAPWPYGDLPAARLMLQRAAELGPSPVSHLFFGDALAAGGDTAGAEAAWRAAAAAPDDEATRWSGELLRELARRRLAAH
jgi:hypothetical protein